MDVPVQRIQDLLQFWKVLTAHKLSKIVMQIKVSKTLCYFDADEAKINCILYCENLRLNFHTFPILKSPDKKASLNMVPFSERSSTLRSRFHKMVFKLKKHFWSNEEGSKILSVTLWWISKCWKIHMVYCSVSTITPSTRKSLFVLILFTKVQRHKSF
jgi:hypothetical protein